MGDEADPQASGRLVRLEIGNFKSYRGQQVCLSRSARAACLVCRAHTGWLLLLR